MAKKSESGSQPTRKPAKKNHPKPGSLTAPDTAWVAPAPVTVPPRAPNPSRKKRNNNPAAPDMPNKKRSPAEMAEAAAAIDEALTRKALIAVRIAELEAQKIAMLAQMELDQEALEEAEAADSVSTIDDIPLADIQRMPTAEFAALGASLGDPPHPSDPEDIPIDIFHLTFEDLDKDYDEIVADKKKEDARKLLEKVMKGAAKKTKGSTRAAVDEAKEQLKENKKRKGEEGEEKETSKKLKPAFPSGFVSNWRDQVPTAAVKSKVTKTIAAEPSGPLGGLTDFDAGSTAPTNLDSKKGHRQLQVVEILSDSDSETDTPVKSTQVKLLPKKYNPELAVKVKVERGGEPPLPRFDLSAVVASGRRGVQTTPVHAPPGPAPATITAGNSGGTGIPGYAQSRWVTDFLPTMHAALGTMENMWELPGGDVKFIQMIWDRVHPGSGYVVALGCPVYTKAKDRINDKRSYFGRRAAAVVDALFQTEEFMGDHKKTRIARFAKYALRDDGPGIWGTPAPLGVKKGQPGYTAPEDVFTSDHVINVFAPFVKSTAGTVYNYGFLRGGLAMSLTGLERAWMKYLSGAKIDDGAPFSRDQVSTLVADYYQSVNALSTRRWQLIMDKVRAKNLEDVPVPLSASTMESNRHQLFIPSSP